MDRHSNWWTRRKRTGGTHLYEHCEPLRHHHKARGSPGSSARRVIDRGPLLPPEAVLEPIQCLLPTSCIWLCFPQGLPWSSSPELLPEPRLPRLVSSGSSLHRVF